MCSTSSNMLPAEISEVTKLGLRHVAQSVCAPRRHRKGGVPVARHVQERSYVGMPTYKAVAALQAQ